jgi:hypothetical protein
MTNDIDEIKKIRKNRLDICKACDFFVQDSTLCNKCGCIMSIKTNLPEAKCPMGKW